MINAYKLPEFLWELVVACTAYLQNQAYTLPIGDHTPYEIWHNNKPNVAHLHEFSTPVWILHQGQAKQQKLQPKPQCCWLSFLQQHPAVLLLQPEGSYQQVLSEEEEEGEGWEQKKRKSEGNGGGNAKRQKKDVVNVAEEEVISFMVDEGDGQDYNHDTFDVSDSMAMDECVSYYGDWVADTGTTSHIINK